MITRRSFALQLAGLSATAAVPALAAVGERRTATKSGQRVLVLGGTGHLGPHFVQAALQAGHRVSVFSRGKSATDLPPQVERLVGDRNGDLGSIKQREWDIVIDVATLGPAWVRSLGQALKGRVGHYTFVSSIGVYDNSGNQPVKVDEDSRLMMYKGTADPYSVTTFDDDEYGALKAFCEVEAQAQFPGRVLNLRPCYITGPGDRVGALAYWALRMQKGGEVLAAGDPLAPINLIDVRDLCQWAIHLAGRRETGNFNTSGPVQPMNWGGLLKTLGTRASTPVQLTWVPVSWLSKHEITAEFDNLLFWTTGVSSGGMLISNKRALGKGLVLRPVTATAEDSLAWYGAQQAEEQQQLLLGFEGKKEGLNESMARERSLLTAWHEDAGGA